MLRPQWRDVKKMRLAAALVLVFGSIGEAQTGSQLLLVPVSETATDLTAAVLLNASTMVEGWSFGVAHDPTVAQIVDVVDGATTVTVNNGGPPDFSAISLLTDGWTVGVVISFLGTASLAPGADYELNVADYIVTTLAGECLALDFTSSLGSPPVAVVVVSGGQSVTPAQFGLCGPPTSSGPTFVGGATVEFSGDTVEVVQQIDDSAFGYALDTQGFSMALANNPVVAAPIAVVAVGVVAALNGGAGPAFFQEGLYPNGFTVGCVYSFLGFETIAFDPPQDVVATTYAILGEGSLGLEFVDGVLGDPPVANILVAGGASSSVGGVEGEIEIVLPTESLRGDCNDDGLVDIADGIFILNALFFGGPLGTCAIACDVNDDGMLDSTDAMYVFLYRFLDGAAPVAPFPDCGMGTGQLPADCVFYSSCL